MRQLSLTVWTLLAVSLTLIAGFGFHFLSSKDSFILRMVIGVVGSIFGLAAIWVICIFDEIADTCHKYAEEIETVFDKPSGSSPVVGDFVFAVSHFSVVAIKEGITGKGMHALWTFPRRRPLTYSYILFLGVWWLLWAVLVKMDGQ